MYIFIVVEQSNFFMFALLAGALHTSLERHSFYRPSTGAVVAQ